MKEVVVIPTYNERENIAQIIHAIFRAAPDLHIAVVDDNSPDGTGEVVRQLQATYPHLELLMRRGKEGLGKAYIDAFRQIMSRGGVRAVVMMDADLSHDPAYLPRMLELSRQGYGVVVGSRYAKGGKTVGWELWRRILSFGGNLYCRIVTGLPIKDCTGGFNVIDTVFLSRVDFSRMDMSGYAFIMELKYMLFQAGARFAEVPIVFTNRVGGESKMSGHIISEGVWAPWKMILKK